MREPSTVELWDFGYRPGFYVFRCLDCQQRREASKRSLRCYDCAVAAWRAAQTTIADCTTIGIPPAPDASRYHHLRRTLSAALGLTEAEVDGLVDRQRVVMGSEEVGL